MVMHNDVTVAVLGTRSGLVFINQDTSLTGCTWREYRNSRTACTKILVGAPPHGRFNTGVVLQVTIWCTALSVPANSL